MMGKVLIGVIVFFSCVVVIGLYTCLVVGKEADEKMAEFMSDVDSSDAVSEEVKR